MSLPIDLEKTIVALEAIMNDIPVELDGYTYCFCEGDKICLEVKRIIMKPGQPQVERYDHLIQDIDLNWFIKRCKSISNEQIAKLKKQIGEIYGN